MACRRFRRAIRVYAGALARLKKSGRGCRDLFWASLVGVNRRIGLPVSYPAGIYVYEIGLWVIANSASFHRCGSFSKFGKGTAGQSDVNGLPCHVQTMLGDAAGVTLEIAIGGR